MTWWVPPLQDIHGFNRRYVIANIAIAVAAVAGTLLADRFGAYRLATLLADDDLASFCNFAIASRFVFICLVMMEATTVVALVFRALQGHTGDPDGSTRLWPFTTLGARQAVAMLALLLWLHLGAYTIVLHANDVCGAGSLTGRLYHYASLIAFAVLQAAGSAILFCLVMIALKRYAGHFRRHRTI